MKLRKLVEYKTEGTEKSNPWEIKDVVFGDLNLIIGMNGTGKTRLFNLIELLSGIIKGQNSVPKRGSWQLEFNTDDDQLLNYRLECEDGKVKREVIELDGTKLIDRKMDKATIISATDSNPQHIEPPADKLIVQVRRDKKEYPFLEDLYQWASNTYCYSVSELLPVRILGLSSAFGSSSDLLDGFEFAPQIWDRLSSKSKTQLLKDFNELGFNLKMVRAKRDKSTPFNAKFLHFLEKDLEFPIPHHKVSTGMFRAFVELVTIQFAVEHDEVQKTILIDDFSDGLDYQRADLLNKVVQEKIKGKNVQLILTSNSRVLMNNISIENWNILVKDGNKVKSFNYENSKEKFDKFKDTGLSNFALFSSDFLEQ